MCQQWLAMRALVTLEEFQSKHAEGPIPEASGSLWLFTFERNAIARAFYERHGFKIIARGFEPTWKLNDLRFEWRDSP